MWLLNTIRLITRITSRIIYAWLWWIPTRLTVIAIAGYFGFIYLLYDTIHVSEIKQIYGDKKWGYFFGFFLPFAFPMFLAFISALAHGKGSSGSSLFQAIKFRNGQMRIKPPIEASTILRKTAFLDALNSNVSDTYHKARRGYDAQYGNSSPTRVFKDLMKDD